MKEQQTIPDEQPHLPFDDGEASSDQTVEQTPVRMNPEEFARRLAEEQDENREDRNKMNERW